MFYHTIFKTSTYGPLAIIADCTYEQLIGEVLIPYSTGERLKSHFESFDKFGSRIEKILRSERSFTTLCALVPEMDVNPLHPNAYVKDVTDRILNEADQVLFQLKNNNDPKKKLNVPQVQPRKESPGSVNGNSHNHKIFIVHGHDETFKYHVKDFLQNLNLEGVILHQQANQGQTVIEKLEKHTDVGYAVILYTPCDLGKSKAAGMLSPRARQNVVFEHGLLVGKLGRNRVAVLAKKGVERPGDISGLVWIGEDNWKDDLRKELKAAGYSV